MVLKSEVAGRSKLAHQSARIKLRASVTKLFKLQEIKILCGNATNPENIQPEFCVVISTGSATEPAN
jgi:hypothetical protein